MSSTSGNVENSITWSTLYIDITDAIRAVWHIYPIFCLIVIACLIFPIIFKIWDWSPRKLATGLTQEFMSFFNKKGNKIERLDFITVIGVLIICFTLVSKSPISKIIEGTTNSSPYQNNGEYVYTFLCFLITCLTLMASLAYCKKQ